MDFTQAENRFRELRKMLAAGQVTMSQYEKEATQLRVLSGDGVWWAIRQQDGMWVRWDGAVWKVAEPPHRKATQPSFPAVKPATEETQAPPAGVVLKGEEALRQLLQAGRVREEPVTGGAVRYVPVNLKPGGMLRGVAYAVGPDGALSLNLAILYDTGAAADELEKQLEARRISALAEQAEENAEKPVAPMRFPVRIQGWWRVQVPGEGAAAESFLQPVKVISEKLDSETQPEARTRLLKVLVELCESTLENLGESAEPPVLGGIHAGLAAAYVELGIGEKAAKRREALLHIAEDHAELAEGIALEGGGNQVAFDTLDWLLTARRQAVKVAEGAQVQALKRRLKQTENSLAQLLERSQAEKKQVEGDLSAAQSLEASSRESDDPGEWRRVLEVAQRQVRAALQGAVSLGDQGLAAQCHELLAKIDAGLQDGRGGNG